MSKTENTIKRTLKRKILILENMTITLQPENLECHPLINFALKMATLPKLVLSGAELILTKVKINLTNLTEISEEMAIREVI